MRSPTVRARKKSSQRRLAVRRNGNQSSPRKTGMTPTYTPRSAKVVR
jgi:hypothetical protein